MLNDYLIKLFQYKGRILLVLFYEFEVYENLTRIQSILLRILNI